MKQQHYTKGVMGILMLLLSATASFAQYTITSPTASTVWESGKMCTITWTNTPISPAKFNIRFTYQDGPMAFSSLIAEDVDKNLGSYSYLLPAGQSPGKFYTICFEDANEMEYLCSPTFSIKDPEPSVSPFTLTSPTNTTTWEAGKPATVTWTAGPDAPAKMNILVRYDNTVNLEYHVGEDVPSADGIFVFTVPANWNGGKYYALCLLDASETPYVCSAKFTVKAATTGISETSSRVDDISIYPMPVTSESVLKFILKEKARVKITLLDITGKEVSCLKDEDFAAGAVDVSFGKPEQSGIYFLRIEAGSGSVTRKVIVY